MHRLKICAGFLLVLLATTPARADVTLLVGAPYGPFGSLSPTGHAAVYFTRICAESPTVLRRCRVGETGAVISRYQGVGGVDWVAIPLIPFLYAVDRASDVPASATKHEVFALRDGYRRRHLRDLVPDGEGGLTPRGHWIQLVGAAYDRHVVTYTVSTSAEQDDEAIRVLNGRSRTPRFNFLFNNCADFARDVINFYYPKAIRNSVVADLGLTTPKHLAKAIVGFAAERPELDLFAFVVAQVPGSRRVSSHGPRGVLEALVKTKKYLVPLTIVQPWLPVGFAAGYLVTGRFDPARHVDAVFQPVTIERWAGLRVERRDLAP